MAYDIEDYDGHFFATQGCARLRNLLLEPRLKFIDPADVRLGPPVARPGKIMCLGANYAAHAREFQHALPEVPIIFTKAATSINGPFDPIAIPTGTEVVDLEVELAVVIGRRARRVKAAEAMQCLAGAMVLNDVTDRVAQKKGQQWFVGKSADTFCPMGPYLVTPDEAGDLDNLELSSSVNDITLQNGNTRDMMFKIPAIVEYLSRSITLEPGDVIATGTPAGIGSARKEPLVLKPGDTIEISVQNLGAQRNAVVAEE